MNIKKREKIKLLILPLTMKELEKDNTPIFDMDMTEALDIELIDFIKNHCTIKMTMKQIEKLPKDMSMKAMAQAVIQNL